MIQSVQACLERPTAEGLAQEFVNFGLPHTEGRYPCRRSRDLDIGGPRITNQCAVRMSVALCRSMNNDIFGAFTGGNVHSTNCCSGENKFRHITRAQSLFDYLNDTLNFNFQRVGSSPAELSGRKGILFLRHCFRGGRGSHIDYWNGTTYTNSASGNAAASSSLGLFRTSSDIYFCALL